MDCGEGERNNLNPRGWVRRPEAMERSVWLAHAILGYWLLNPWM